MQDKGLIRFVRRPVSTVCIVVMMTAYLVAIAAAADASTGPFTPSLVSTHTNTNIICRAFGGSLAPNTEADQRQGFTVTAPDAVRRGDTFDIKLKPDLAIFPQQNNTTPFAPAQIKHIHSSLSQYQVPEGVSINDVTVAPTDGDVEADPDAGFYVNPRDVPDVDIPGNFGLNPDPNFDPLTLPPSKLLPIPGTPMSVMWNTETNRLKVAQLGRNTDPTQYQGGSELQLPTITITVTADEAEAGTDLQFKQAGTLPKTGNFVGTQPGNFPPPAAASGLVETPAAGPWHSTDGKNWTFSNEPNWTDPAYTNTVEVFLFLNVSAKAACGPGWEPTAKFPTPPDYYTGPDAIPNGTFPALSHTTVLGIGATGPAEGAQYATGQVVTVDYACLANPTEAYDQCVGDQADGTTLDTSTPGDHTFTITGTDPFAPPVNRTINYSVADNTAPVADAGADQSGVLAGQSVELDATGSVDPDTQVLTYTWSQVANGAPVVSLSDIHATNPTFTVAPVDNPTGHGYEFTVNVDDGMTDTSDSAAVASVASTPTVPAGNAGYTRTGPSAPLFFTGETLTLGATIVNPDGTDAADYTYVWNQTAGLPTPLAGADTPNPTYVLPATAAGATCSFSSSVTAGCPRYGVVVTNVLTGKASATSNPGTMSATAGRPTAVAGPVQYRGINRTITLDGTASSQPQGHALTYAWTQTGGTDVTGDPAWDATAAQPTFTAPAAPTALAFSLTVTDPSNPIAGTGTAANTSLPSTTTVNVTPDAVVANAGPDQAAAVAGTITLDGSVSSDPDGLPLAYTWTQVANGAPTVTLDTTNPAQPTFVAAPITTPAAVVYQVNLSVTNGGADPTDSATTTTPVSVTVNPATPSVTITRLVPPPGNSFTTYPGQTVTLNVNITNPDGNAEGDYTYVWAQASGIVTPLDTTNPAHPTLVAPLNPSGAPCTSGFGVTSCPRYTVTVTKTSTGKAFTTAASAMAFGTVTYTQPVADQGEDQAVEQGEAVKLNGYNYRQNEGNPVDLAWSQVDNGAPTVLLDTTDPTRPTFTAPTGYTGSIQFTVTATDTVNPRIGTGVGLNMSVSAPVTIAVSVPSEVTYTSVWGPSEYAHLYIAAVGLQNGNLAEVQKTGALFMAFLKGEIESAGSTPPVLGPNVGSGPLELTSTYSSSEAQLVQDAADFYGSDPQSLQRFGVLLIAYLFLIS